jgi:hypothetical protein
MRMARMKAGRKWFLFACSVLCASVAGANSPSFAAARNAAAECGSQAASAQSQAARQVGTIKTIEGNHIVLTTDAGDFNVSVQDSATIVRVEPGAKDLKNAMPLDLKDLQVGDRILVRGQNSPDAKSFAATSVIAMKHADVEANQQEQRDEWRHGIGGIVSSVDPAAGVIAISAGAAGSTTSVSIRVAKDTVIRRYAPDSVKFEDAKVSSLDAIHPGDQLRARGVQQTDFQAKEIVTGSFRNIAGTVSSIDPATNTVQVMDAIAKRSVVVRITDQSQVRKLAPEIAQRIAMRLKAADAQGNQDANAAPANPAGAGAAGSNGNAPAGRGRGPAPDLQQMLARLPAVKVSDLQKGDAVMIVSTAGDPSAPVTAITLLAGVDPILTASPKGAQAMVLSPWSLGGGGDADATP